MIIEEWKSIRGYEGLYEVSSFGRVRRLYKSRMPKILKPQTNQQTKYLYVNLSKNDNRKACTIHRLVAEAFIPKPKELGKIYIDHIDGSRINNNVSNLRWCTFRENCCFPIAAKNRQNSHAESYGIKVAQLDESNNIINKFSSVREAERVTGIFSSNIHRVLKGICVKAGGYKWKRI